MSIIREDIIQTTLLDLVSFLKRSESIEYQFENTNSLILTEKQYFLRSLLLGKIPTIVAYTVGHPDGCIPMGKPIFTNAVLLKFFTEILNDKPMYVEVENNKPRRITEERESESQIATNQINSLDILKLCRKLKIDDTTFDEIFYHLRTQKVCHIKVFSNSADDLQSYADRIRYCNSIHR